MCLPSKLRHAFATFASHTNLLASARRGAKDRISTKMNERFLSPSRTAEAPPRPTRLRARCDLGAPPFGRGVCLH